ncbi:MAG: sodium:solute symporter family protein [Putridiphycobacter sp.]
MTTIDWLIFIIYLAAVFVVGVIVSKKSSSGINSYFVADRSLPWWWIGISIIATTFAADTPLAITGITAETGIAGNWLWWSWAATYITVSVFFAKRWRQSHVLTDVEFIELRYSGKEAAFLRGFKAFFYGIVLNVFILGWVITAAVKIADAFIDWHQILGADVYAKIEAFYPSFLLFKSDFNATLTILVLLLIVMIYSSLGGIRGVILTDLFQFAIAIIISIIFGYYAVQEVGGLHEIQEKLVTIYGQTKADHLTEFFPSFDNPLVPFQIFLIYVVIQWWVRYDSDGSGYIAQRINTAKSPKDAQKGSFLFSILFIVLRTWPWIMVALVSLIIFPLEYNAEGEILGDREAYYPILMTKVLPVGLVGLAFTSLMAAFMSTVDTHLNWGSSYLTNDIYRRFIKPKADQKSLVKFSRIMVIIITFLAVIVASQIDSISGAWRFFINAASGLGIAQLIRWFWWRANAWTEISSMLAALTATFLYPILFSGYAKLPHFDTYALVGITLFSIAVSVITTLLTPAVEIQHLKQFIERCNPVGIWKGNGHDKIAIKGFVNSSVMWVLGLTASFSGLFSIGYFLMLKPWLGGLNIIISTLSFFLLNRMIKKENESFKNS